MIIRLCALATAVELDAAVAAFPAISVTVVRPPETGLVMIEGRIGGDGPPFNVGEATVTRAVVRLSTGQLGFSYLLGRRTREAQLAAVVDALARCPDKRPSLEAAFVTPVTARLALARAEQKAETDATRVAFFTLERGEDAA